MDGHGETPQAWSVAAWLGLVGLVFAGSVQAGHGTESKAGMAGSGTAAIVQERCGKARKVWQAWRGLDG